MTDPFYPPSPRTTHCVRVRGHFGDYFTDFIESLNGICAYLASNFINLSLCKERGFRLSVIFIYYIFKICGNPIATSCDNIQSFLYPKKGT